MQVRMKHANKMKLLGFWDVQYLLVALEHGGSDEGFLTQVTLVLLASIVHHLYVYIQRVLALKRGVALVALERPLTWMERTDETWDIRGEGTISTSSCTKGARLLLSCLWKLPPPLVGFFCVCVPTALWEPLCCPKCLSSFGNCSIILPELFFTLKDTGVCTHVYGKGRGARNEKEKWGGRQIRLKQRVRAILSWSHSGFKAPLQKPASPSLPFYRTPQNNGNVPQKYGWWKKTRLCVY